MSGRTETFPIGTEPTIEVTNSAGDITIRSWDEPNVKISLTGDRNLVDGAVIDVVEDHVSVRSQTRGRRFTKRMSIVITAPEGGTVRARVGAGDVRVRARVTDVSIESGAGDIRVDQDVQRADIRVATGDVWMAGITEDADIDSAAGDIRLGDVANARVNTASGDIRVDSVSEAMRIKSASGDITVRRFSGTDLEMKTMSGDIRVSLAPNMEIKAAIKTLSGDFLNKTVASDGPKTGSATLRATSFSGDVTLLSAD